jgi:hypothetical protein
MLLSPVDNTVPLLTIQHTTRCAIQALGWHTCLCAVLSTNAYPRVITPLIRHPLLAAEVPSNISASQSPKRSYIPAGQLLGHCLSSTTCRCSVLAVHQHTLLHPLRLTYTRCVQLLTALVSVSCTAAVRTTSQPSPWRACAIVRAGLCA